MLVSWVSTFCRCLPLTICEDTQPKLTPELQYLPVSLQQVTQGLCLLFLYIWGPEEGAQNCRKMPRNPTETILRSLGFFIGLYYIYMVQMAETEFLKMKEPSQSKVQISGVTTLGLQKSLV
jgi:hypothetical protein